METSILKRKLVNIKSPAAHRGFLGPDHTARAVIQNEFKDSDPFIILMDDFLDKKDTEPVGGPHPHAGFETVSLLLEGEIGDEAHMMRAGDFQIMTAGSGIVHTESIEKESRMRLLQMWLNLPKKDRWATPRVQDIALGSVPKIVDNGLEIRLYSGELAGMKSPIQNHTPLIVAEIHLQPGAETRQQLNASYNAFLYVVEGSVEVGDARETLTENQIGWLSKSTEVGESELVLAGGSSGGKVVLYAAEPQNHPIVSYGPFIADREDEIKDLYRDFRQGKIGHVSELPAAQRFSY
ncbi:pirin family protein [Dyadobacter sp. CY343]|uniref:pirin family protein n=1 Tax=Dyadobacter sp. CY343 TaxID=2907299 RepID=UPI001F2E6E77|nr:pirin-like C-terminal cupin domain-containing protein [Dyadobacter sp. CY343]MCE7060799.1 pirin family protein [Dyadobacter sp. CY343]